MSAEMDEYLFDLRGYVMLENAVDRDHLAEMDAILDTYRDLEPGEWRGWVRRSPHNQDSTRQLHQLFEMGEPFERLIDHPSWIDHIARFVGGDDGLFIDESFVDIRQKSAATPLHSGAHKRRIRTQYRYHNGQFRCGQINILLALNDIGPFDGGTMVIPCSHKSNLLHPAFKSGAGKNGLANVEGAIEVNYKAGDVLLFVDNVFRFSQAGSEVSALLGRTPSAVGYQPTLSTEMGNLQERIQGLQTQLDLTAEKLMVHRVSFSEATEKQKNLMETKTRLQRECEAVSYTHLTLPTKA